MAPQPSRTRARRFLRRVSRRWQADASLQGWRARRDRLDWLYGTRYLAIATSVSTAGITVVLEHDTGYDVGSRASIPSDLALGGCSGAPLLTLVEQNSIYSWRLGGIIYESSQKTPRFGVLKPQSPVIPGRWDCCSCERFRGDSEQICVLDPLSPSSPVFPFPGG